MRRAGQSPPHWYLGYLGTRRGRQGQRLGTQMLRQVLAGADTDGVPAYLESSSERNLPLHERNGFRVIGKLQALGHGPTIWRMWREPRPAPEAGDGTSTPVPPARSRHVSSRRLSGVRPQQHTHRRR
jgi:GNAT superfamily N-acetyltransferase